MQHLIDHLGDDDVFLAQLALEKDETWDRLKREHSKKRLTFKDGGELQIKSAEASHGSKEGTALLGFGSKNLIIDESSLIPDPIYSLALRMLGDQKQNFLVEIGNPFYRNHFFQSWKDARYNKIFIDYTQALLEGRYAPEYIEEMRRQARFRELYECRFPSEGGIDMSGFQLLLSSSQLYMTFLPARTHLGFKICGIDPAAGGDNTSFVLRSDLMAESVYRQQTPDTTIIPTLAARLMTEHSIDWFVIDMTGVGYDIFKWMQSLGLPVTGVGFGEGAENPSDAPDRYFNKKAELFWSARNWLSGGGKLLETGNAETSPWNQILWCKWKTAANKAIQIMSKELIYKEHKASPDDADALALTFALPVVARREEEEEPGPPPKTGVWS